MAMQERLDDPQVRAAVLNRLRTLALDSPRQWGRMNAHQAVCHLSDAFRVMMQPEPAPPQSNLFTRTILRWLALHAPARWPQGAKTMPYVDQEIGGSKPVEFAGDRQALESLIEQFVKRTSADLQPHPIFGRLTDAEWQRWAYRHMDHHLRQFGR